MTSDTQFHPTQGRPQLEGLTLVGKKYIVRDHLSAIAQIVLALAAARTLGWNNAWLYAALAVATKLSVAIIVAHVNPAVLNARGTKHTMSPRERKFFAVFIPAMMAVPIVAGLDVGAVGWTHHSMAELALGLASMVVGVSIVIWALAVNPFFEPTVRLQRDREQRVCTSGPYAYVRHPGYVGAILASVGTPLVFGSYWALVPAAMATFALVVRTAYEDRMLRAELSGYEAYATKTRFRLVPLLW